MPYDMYSVLKQGWKFWKNIFVFKFSVEETDGPKLDHIFEHMDEWEGWLPCCLTSVPDLTNVALAEQKQTSAAKFCGKHFKRADTVKAILLTAMFLRCDLHHIFCVKYLI